MSKSISEINDRLKELNKKYKKSGLTDGKISHKAAMSSLKGSDKLKMSDEAKKQISKSLKGKPKSKIHKENLKKKKLKYKITREQILNAQIGTTTAKQVADKLGIDFNTYKRIATYHKAYKKQLLSERNSAKADIIDVWEYHPDFKLNRGKYIGRMSKPDARNNLGINNMNKFFDGIYVQVNGYVLEKIK